MNAEIFDFPAPPPSNDDLEFSDYGRDPRFGPGWYILPLFALIAIVIGAVTALSW